MTSFHRKPQSILPLELTYACFIYRHRISLPTQNMIDLRIAKGQSERECALAHCHKCLLEPIKKPRADWENKEDSVRICFPVKEESMLRALNHSTANGLGTLSLTPFRIVAYTWIFNLSLDQNKAASTSDGTKSSQVIFCGNLPEVSSYRIQNLQDRFLPETTNQAAQAMAQARCAHQQDQR